MRYRAIRSNELSPDFTARWDDLQLACKGFASPYFCPEFVQHVGAVRDDVWIGILEENDRIDGVFPFHRKRGGVGRPIGLGLSDYHGVIVEAGAEWDALDLLRGCGLIRYEFDHLLAQQKPFAAYHQAVSDSPIIDFSTGYAAFEESRDRAGRKQLREIDRKHEKLKADYGAVEFQLHSASAEDLHTLMTWKSEQCQRTGTFDYFAIPWCRQLIERIHQSPGDEFGGLLSTLRVDGNLAAAHFAMRSKRVWHSWFPVYCEEYRDYSPGLILLLQIIRTGMMPGGPEYLDFGKGMSLYKRRFMTSSISVASGVVEMPSILNSVRHCRDAVERWSKSSVLKPVFQIPGRVVKSMERRAKYD